ncbi:hypothetical protein D3C77_608700 [compost metagenome]
MVSQLVGSRTEQINTETHGAFGEAGLVVEHEGLAPLAAFGAVFGVLSEVVITQIQVQLAVLDEVSGSELAHAQGADGYGNSHGSFFHVSLQFIFLFRGGRRLSGALVSLLPGQPKTPLGAT